MITAEEWSNLQKALFTLLYDQFDCPDLELNMDAETWVDYIVSALIEKNENNCPYKNYDCIKHCESHTDKCKDGLSITCGIEPEIIWKNFIKG